MKQLFLNLKHVVLTVLIFSLLSCNNNNDDDNSITVTAPNASYPETTLEATFFQKGNSSAPTINWNGNQGSFSLAKQIIGLSINTKTGELNWTKDLPLGTHNIEVTVTNSAGATTKKLTLNNPLQGIFSETDVNEFFELEFNPNGNLTIKAYDKTYPSIATGTWTRNGETVDVNYTYSDSNDEYSLSGTLTIDTSVIYSGDWYNGHNGVSGNEGGVFEFSLN